MAKLIVSLIVLGVLLSSVWAQLVVTPSAFGVAAPVNPEDEAAKFADIGNFIIQSRIQKANLPDDLLASGFDIALNSRDAYAGCKTTLGTNHVIWQYRLCVISNMKAANMALSQLETEARARELAAAATAAAAAAEASAAAAAPQ